MTLGEPDRTELVELNRTTLRLWEWGDPSAPPILCVHGALDHGRMWDELAPRVADWGYRVVALDCRGHGDSGPLHSGHLWYSLAIDHCLLARRLGPPIGLIGHSMGAGQAMFVAGVWPELVRWVINLDGLGPSEAGFDQGQFKDRVQRSLSAVQRISTSPARVYASQDEMVERRLQVNHRMPRPWMEHLVRHGTRQVEGGWVWKADPHFMVGFPGDFSFAHLLAEQALTRAPMLVLTGAEPDMWSELTEEEKEARLAPLPSATHEVIEDAGHYVHLEQPDAVLDAMHRFLKEVDG